MALWGNKDSKTASGTVSITTGGAVTGSSTAFTTEAKVGNTIKVGTDEYVIVSIASNTSCKVVSGINGATPVAKTGQSYTLSEKPTFVAHESHETVGKAGDTSKVFGVDTSEEAVAANKAKGMAHSGWIRTVAGTGGRSGRFFTEVLVAGGSITADAADDATVADLAITIGTQPANVSVTAPAPATFTVVATTNGSLPITYQWEIQQEGAGGWTAISGATSASYTTGATATGDGAGATDGDKYRVVITSGSATATSNAATLTVA